MVLLLESITILVILATLSMKGEQKKKSKKKISQNRGY